jgi:hypothetical protein
VIMGVYSLNEQVFHHRVQRSVAELAGSLSIEEQQSELNAGFAFNAWHRFEIGGFDQRDPGSSWSGADRWRVTNRPSVDGFVEMDRRAVRDLFGFERMELRLYQRISPRS